MKRVPAPVDSFETVRAVGLTLPNVEAATKYDGLASSATTSRSGLSRVRALRDGSLEFAYADLWRYSLYVMSRQNFAVRRADFADARHVRVGRRVLVWRKRARS